MARLLPLLSLLALSACTARGEPTRPEWEVTGHNPVLPGREEPPIYREEVFEKLGFKLLFKSQIPLEQVHQWWMGRDSIFAMTESTVQPKQLRFYSVDRETGVVKWMEDIEKPISGAPVETENHVYFLSEDTVFDIDRRVHPFTKREYGNLRGRLPLEHIAWDRTPSTHTTPLRTVLYLNTIEGYFVHENGSFPSKHTRWQETADYETSFFQNLKLSPIYFSASSPIAAMDQRVFVGGVDYRLYALNPVEEKRMWAYKMAGEVTTVPVVKGELVYFASEDSSIVCCDARTGYRKWEFHSEWPTDYALVTNPKDIGPMARRHDWHFSPQRSLQNHMAVEGDYLWVASHDGNFYCLHRASGETLALERSHVPFEVAPWPKPRSERVEQVEGGGAALAAGGDAGAEGGGDAGAGGAVPPAAVAAAPTPVHGPARYPKEPDVYSLNRDGDFVAWKLATTEEMGAANLGTRFPPNPPTLKLKLLRRWTLPGGRRVVGWGQPPRKGVAASVYILKKGDVLAAVNEETGEIRWEYPMAGVSFVLPSPREKPMLYVGTKDGWCYALIERREYDRRLWQEMKDENEAKKKYVTDKEAEKKMEEAVRGVEFQGLPGPQR